MVRKGLSGSELGYKRLADQNPHNPVYLNKLGIALHQQAALAMALKYYERASKADPSMPMPEQYRHHLVSAKEIWQGHQGYQKAIGIRNGHAVLLHNLAYAFSATRI